MLVQATKGRLDIFFSQPLLFVGPPPRAHQRPGTQRRRLRWSSSGLLDLCLGCLPQAFTCAASAFALGRAQAPSPHPPDLRPERLAELRFLHIFLHIAHVKLVNH